MACCCWMSTILMVFGAIAFMKFTLGVISFFTKLFRFSSNMSQYRDGKNSYAVITGGSSGIGLAYAKEFAKRGFNLVLLAQREEKLQAAKSDIEAKYKDINVITKSINFAAPSATENMEVIKAILKPLDVAVLVNNVGVTVEPPGQFDEIPEADIEKIINVNIRTMSLLTHAVIPQMLKRKRSLVVSLSSFVSRMPVPMLAPYSASKRYIEQLSDAMGAEYKGRIDFTCVAPWWVATEMTKIKKTSLRVISPEHLARSSMTNLGKTNLIDPYWLHALLDALVVIPPKALVFSKMLSFMKFLRRVHFSKEAKKNAAKSN